MFITGLGYDPVRPPAVGVRVVAVVHLTWADIDFGKGAVRIVANQGITGVVDWQPKDSDGRDIPTPDETVELLSGLRVKTGFGSKHVFIPAYRVEYIQQRQPAGMWKEGRASLNNINRSVRAIPKQAGVDDISLHDLRRSCITHWARRLASHVTRPLAGHRSITTTLRYYVSVQEDDLLPAKDAVVTSLLSNAIWTQKDDFGMVRVACWFRKSITRKPLRR